MKILCFRNSKLGDFLISIGTLNLIKKKNPGCEITYLTDRNKNLKYLPTKIENQKIVNNIIYYDYSFKGLIDLIIELRKKKFDKVINLQDEKFFSKKLRNYIFFSFCKIPKKIGFFYKNKSYRLFSETVQLAKRIDRNFKASKIYELNKLKIKNEKAILSGDYITISHGGYSSPRLWDMNNWKILLRLFINNYNYKVIILGSKSEKKAANSLTQINRKMILNMCGTDLEELFNNIKFSKLHITNDNGTMHVSTIYNKKVICLFDNNHPYGKWFPENKNALILRPKNGICETTPYLVFNKIKNLI